MEEGLRIQPSSVAMEDTAPLSASCCKRHSLWLLWQKGNCQEGRTRVVLTPEDWAQASCRATAGPTRNGAEACCGPHPCKWQHCPSCLGPVLHAPDPAGGSTSCFLVAWGGTSDPPSLSGARILVAKDVGRVIGASRSAAWKVGFVSHQDNPEECSPSEHGQE